MSNHITEQNVTQTEFLTETKFREKKLLSNDIADVYEVLEMPDKAKRLKGCGTYLEFRGRLDGSQKLSHANFCKVRLCPMCGWRRSLKVFGQVSKVMNHITAEHSHRFLFLTLTVRNTEGVELKDTITHMLNSFHNKFLKSPEIKHISKGWFRCLEVTYSRRREDYHPHIHLVMAVNKSYFSSSENSKTGYMSNLALEQLWKRCCGLEYNPIVDIRAVKQKESHRGNEGAAYSSAVAEIAKYAVKTSDIIARDEDNEIDFDNSDHVLYTLDDALKGRRLVAFGGTFKAAHKSLNLDDTQNGDLVHTDNNDSLGELGMIVYRYQWNVGASNYIKLG